VGRPNGRVGGQGVRFRASDHGRMPVFFGEKPAEGFSPDSSRVDDETGVGLCVAGP
jgi:hypothetical protein